MALTAEQKALLEQIVRPGRKIKDPKVRRIYRRAAAQTAIVESGISNPAGGDADSQGWRQERASLYPNPQNVKASARRFRDEFLQQYQPGEKSYEVAAQVQRPAAQYRDRYRQVAGQAKEALREIRGAGPSGGGGGRAPGRVEEIQQYQPGVDNSGMRKTLLLQYLADRGKPDALLSLASGLKQAQDTPGTTSTKYVKVPGQKTGGNLLVVGDSLAVGTSQFLKHAKTNAKVGRTSTASIRDARKGLTSGRYGRILLDFGSNDQSARELVRSVRKAQRLAPGAKIFVPVIKGGPGAAEKTAALQRLDGVTLVPWSTPLGPDGVHPADYQARAREIRAAIGGGGSRGGGGKVPGSDILESFYNGAGGANTDSGNIVGKGFVSGHTDHVHFAARTHKEADRIGRVAQQRFGLTVRELEPFDKVDPVHVNGSFHYRGLAGDASGPAANMAAFSRWLARKVRR